jgi:hypothetical protein
MLTQIVASCIRALRDRVRDSRMGVNSTTKGTIVGDAVKEMLLPRVASL